ncbi:MAG: amidohydrolase family protein [Oscillospiraceae bacterium]|nr:amidohydrolase family protein [Oscillospiraceae bacterium]
MYRYINLNGQYGVGQNFKMSYPTAQAVMDQMDRLGIWQTVMEYPPEANALRRNQVLLEDIQKIPHWQERIIPSFQLDVSAVVQTDAMEKIVKMAESCRPCCFTLRPKNSRYRLRLADMPLEYVKHLDPVVFLDIAQLTGPSSADDLIYLAGQYPNMRFVIRQAMYSDYPFLFDVLHRTKNVYADNSRMHTRRALEIFIQFFGEDRLLFSTDTKANNGAAMAAIAWADLTEEVKDKFRFGNFIHLFSDPADRQKLTDNLKAIPNRVKNRFWTPFVERQQAPDTEIYDIHTHMGATGNDWYIYELTLPEQVAAFEKDMERFNIRKIVSSCSGMPHYTSNLEMEAACKGKEDRFKGYVRYNPLYSEKFSEEFLDACMSRGYFIGLKSLPAYMGTDIRDEKYEPMFRYAHEHDVPILLHCWDNQNGLPRYCAEAAAKWPKAQVILGHTGGGDKGRADCEAIAREPGHDNLWFEFCGSFTTDRDWEETLKSIDYRRVLYGTDACLHDIAFEMGRLLSMDLPDEQLEAILGGNAKRLFGF